MPQQRASVGFALIARNAQGTLEACLKSIRPYVQQIAIGVDTLSTDRTAKIAKKYADVVFPVEVSQWHECAAHGRIRAQHFARARNESFQHLDPKLDFHAWVDADDVIENANLLPAICKNLPEHAIGVWSPYWYATVIHEDGTRQVNTLFHRERLLRTRYAGQPVRWDWQHRVHEVVVPVGIDHPQWIQNDDLRWVHQHQAHKTEQSAPRNLTLLEIELEEDPNQPRTVFYMGNQYFAMGDWFNAVQWYEQYTERFAETGNPYELWQSYVYMSLAYERLGDVKASLSAAFGAIDAMPQHPEPYWRLAAIYAQIEQPEKAIYWTEQADQRVDAPFFAFKNPMDRSFNAKLPLADAYMQLGNVSAAKRAYQAAVAVFPDERIKEQAEQAEYRERAAQAASDFVGVASLLEHDAAKLALYESLPEGIKAFGRTRNLAMTILRHGRAGGTQPRIVFYCGKSMEPWAPPTLDRTGIGGSETAVIQIAKRFAAAGWQTDVYGWADYMEGVYDGVGYWDAERYKPEPVDVFVSWRRPDAWTMAPDAKQRVLWCHDLNYGPAAAEHMDKWTHVLGVSAWHTQALMRYYCHAADIESGYGFLQEVNRWDSVPNGIDLSRFADPPKKVPFRCVYASSPDRGLARLLDFWPAIVQAEPEAELHVGYGWENIDKSIAAGRQDLAAFKEHIVTKMERTPRVVWRGRLPQDELATLYAESYAWLYPTDFLEVSCISAMEAMAGGAVPIATRAGALSETIGDAGLLIPGPAHSRGLADSFPKIASGVLMDAGLRTEYAKRGRERAATFTWTAAFERWLDVLGVSGRGNNLAEASASTETSGAPDADGCAPLPEAVAA